LKHFVNQVETVLVKAIIVVMCVGVKNVFVHHLIFVPGSR
jgi:hypothetical protein